jgi:small subunit ribosomal protein S18
MEKKVTPTNEHIDYKDVVRLRAYMNAHARMMSRTRTGMNAHEQRRFAEAVKRARFMSLLPYVAQ